MIEQKNTVMHFKTLEGKILRIRDTLVLIDRDVAELFGIETRDVNKAVKNNLAKFPNGYIIQLDKSEKKELVENFHRFNSLKHSSTTPKAFTEKGLYMLSTILKATLQQRQLFRLRPNLHPKGISVGSLISASLKSAEVLRGSKNDQ